MERAACVTREGKRFDGATVVSILTNAVDMRLGAPRQVRDFRVVPVHVRKYGTFFRKFGNARFIPETLAEFPPVGHYLRASWAASMPAWAQVSSWSEVAPLTPIPPICTLCAVMIGNPPANAVTPGTCAIPGTMPPLRSLP